MNSKKCLKCGHVASFEGPAPLACPGCGAIYSKVEQAAQAATPRPMARPGSQPTTSRVPTTIRTSIYRDKLEAFAADLRSNSLYPTWRELVKWITWLWYAVAIITLIGTAVSTRMAFIPTMGALGMALLLIVVARVGKELSLMLADLSDAAVRIAARADTMEHDAK